MAKAVLIRFVSYQGKLIVLWGANMKIIFIRHGEPDYRELEERSYTGFGIDLAPLSEKGRKQAQDLCQNPLFQSADTL